MSDIPMTKERVVTLRSGLLLPTQELIHECLDEIERLKKELDKAKRLPDSMQEAFNSGDGSYRP